MSVAITQVSKGDCVIVKRGFGRLKDGAYSEVSEVHEETNEVSLFNVWPCGDVNCFGERHRQHERVEHGRTSIENVELYVPPSPRPRGGRIPVRHIKLLPPEGSGLELAEFAGDDAGRLWDAAEDQLRAWGEQGDPDGEGDEVAFGLTFEDGAGYAGTFYLFHPDHPAERGFGLADHIRDFCASFGGLQIPEGGGELIYDLNMRLAPESTAERASFLARYEVGREAVPTIWTAPDGCGGSNFYTLAGTKRVQEWFYGARGWRCRVVAELPRDVREARDVPCVVKAALRSIYPQLSGG